MPRFTFTFQEASPLIAYTGFWTEGNPQNDSFAASYDGSFRVTNSSDAKATLNFFGSGVELFGALRPNHGTYSVSLDQGSPTTSNGVGNNVFKDSLWRASNLPYGQHTVEVINTPTRSAPYFDLDYVSIERQIGFDNDTIFKSTLDDADSLVQYEGSWSSSLSMQARNHEGTLHQTTTANDRLLLNFQGCCIELYGLYANAAYSVSLDNQPPESMQGLDIDLPQGMWHPQTLLYLKDGLPESVNHTVIITATGTTAERPFFFDNAVVRSTQPLPPGETTIPLTTSVQPSGSGSPPPSVSSQSADKSNSSSPQSIPVSLIVVLSVGGAILVALLAVTFLLLRRRWQRHPRYSLDLSAEIDPYKAYPASNPWVSPERAPTPPPSTFQLSSVVPGWQRISADWHYSTGPDAVRSPSIYPQTLGRSGSSTTASRQNLQSLPTTVARPTKYRQFTVTNAGPSTHRDSLISGVSEWVAVPEKANQDALYGSPPPKYNA